MPGRRGLSAAAVIVGLSVVSPSLHAQFVACYLFVGFENIDRIVYGPVTAECEGDSINCFPFVGHTVPWGNWGVDSNVGSRQDGDQFMGWHDGDGHQEWNSCTTAYPTGTQTSDTGVGSHGGGILGYVPNTQCYELPLEGYVVTVTGNYMDLWELDPCDEDEYVATLSYPDVSLVLSQSGANWNGESSWLSPTSVSPSGVATAQIRMTASTGFGCIPGYGC